MKATILAGAILAAIFGALVGLTCLAASASCSMKWRYSGMATKYRPVAGCLLETSPGRWMPASSYRSAP